jgi:mannosyl-oligosaccharide glucosidase
LVYGWEEHDGQSYGRQRIQDERNNIEIVTEFLKIPTGKQGGDWIARVQGKCLDLSAGCKISLIYYLGFDHADGKLYKKELKKDKVHLRGQSSYLGDFSFFVNGF